LGASSGLNVGGFEDDVREFLGIEEVGALEMAVALVVAGFQ